MKQLTKIIGSILLVGGFSMTSCTDDFEKINAPQDNASAQNMNGDNYKTGAFYLKLQGEVIPETTGGYQHCENLTGDVWGRFMMSNAKWKGKNFSEFSYDHVGWTDNPFNEIASFYPAWNEIKKNTNGEGVNFAWAKVLRVAAMHRVTDMYGPIPYSKVETGNLYVPYDSQETVYKTMLQDLSDAVEELEKFVSQYPNTVPMKDYDRVYGGDYSKWIKFANSLKLRMAMRIRFVEPALAKQMAEEAVKSGVITANEDNTGYQPAGNNNFWTIAQSWGDCRVCADITTYMDGYKDPRQSKYFDKSGFDGVTYAGLRSASNASTDLYGKYSKALAGQNDKIIWMTAAEVAFLKAEGALMKWNMGGQTGDAGAKAFYEEGIKLSFEQWGAGDATSYIADDKSTQSDYKDPNAGTENTTAVSSITIKWDSEDSEEHKLERIITQKWIALWPIGYEAWCEYRRTGYPHFFPLVRPAVDSNYNNLLVANRVPFATTEDSNNPENVAAARAMLGGKDDFATKMWWQK